MRKFYLRLLFAILCAALFAFIHRENIQNNYYSIKMLHSDGYVLYSNTIFIKKDNAAQHIFVLNNSFTAQIEIRTGVVHAGPVVFSLYDDAGKPVA